MTTTSQYATKEDIRKLTKEIKELKDLLLSFIGEETPSIKDVEAYLNAQVQIRKGKKYSLEEIRKERKRR